jgi:phosphate:Na+ symporter
MTVFWQILTIIGSLGIFLFGIKLLSESLQKVAGNRMRSVLSAITSNRYRSIFTGLFVTAAIQSSSASSVMIISFVNAGLLSLYQAVGALIGANVGTTVTIWIISLLGFKFSLNIILLPIVAISIPLYFSAKSKLKSWGEVLFGFALLFMGLELMKANLPVLDENSFMVQELARFINHGFFSLLLFVLVGIVFTAVLQSSSVTLALTLVMCNNGWIPFDIAAAMVLGINIGTTSTALIASLIANQTAKKAAVFHLLFNLAGVLWALVFFRYLLNVIAKVTFMIEGASPVVDIYSIPIALSLLHTAFNILTAILVVILFPQFIRLAELLVPAGKSKEQFRLTYLNSPISTSELSLLQARKEIHVFGKRTEAMFELIPQLLIEKDDERFSSLFERISQYEDISDRMEVEIASYLTRLSESELSYHSSKKIRSMLKIIDDMESINDICLKMARLIEQKNNEKAWFSQKMRNEIGGIFDLVRASIMIMNQHLDNYESAPDLNKVLELELAINTIRDELLAKNQKRLNAEKIHYPTAKYFGEFVSHCEKIADLTLNVSQAIAEYQH